MAKFFVTFIILAFIALESNSIYSRIYVQSHPSHSNAAANQPDTIQPASIYPSASSRRHRRHAEIPTHEHRHKLKHHKRYDPHSQDFALKLGDEPNEAAAGESRQRVRRREHYQHQRQHQQEHEQRLRWERLDSDMDRLKTMPRIWQHLQDVEDEKMFADGGGSELAETSNDDLLPELPDFYDYRPYSNEDAEEAFPSLPPPPSSATTNNKAASAESDSPKSAKEKKPVPKGCPKCESDRQVSRVTEEELTQMRIEFVKQQILEKLRLKERPHVSAVSLPKPISEGATIAHQDDEAKSKELDDFYARTSKKFIFLERELTECSRLGMSSMCFSFKLEDADVEKFDVSTAVLWLFKNKQRQLNRTTIGGGDGGPKLSQQIVVSEVQQELAEEYLPIVKTIAIQSVDVQDEWMEIDIMWPIKRWIGNHELSHLIHISCSSCDSGSMEKMISVDKDYRPFIMIDMQNRRRPVRQKRSINCTNGVTECCREKMYISFDSIGWGDWIIQPRGYDAYFCRGSCASVASVAQSTSHHSTFVQKAMSALRASGQKPLDIVLCCTAKDYSPLQMVYMESNHTATQRTLPNMIVNSCGCR